MDDSENEGKERGIEKDNRELLKYRNSKAENKFYNYIREKKPELKVTKKGLPDFMIIKDKKVVGFVEVKRTDANDGFRENQALFMLFCREHNIPYQVWSPNMAGRLWEKANKGFKKRWTYGGEIWDK
ncbi:unnamed protein product, partial [marine sediment metagenome]